MMIGEGSYEKVPPRKVREHIPLQVCALHTVLHSLGVGLVDVLGVLVWLP